MKRRDFITLLGGAAAAWPLMAWAQQGGMPTIGLLWPADAPPVFPRMESFRQGLRASGLVEGQNVALELRYAQRGPQQLPELAAELVRLKVDAIFTGGDLAARVAQQATGTIPIVTISDDIIGAGLIASLSRPGGNITGVTILAPELSAKRLEVLRDIIPGLSRVTALHDPTNGTSQVIMAESCGARVEREAAGTGHQKPRRRRSGNSRGARYASAGPQRFLFPASFIAASGDHHLGGGIRSSGNLSVEGTRRGRRTGVIRPQSRGHVAAISGHYRQGPQGRKACGRAGRATDEARIGGEF
jgi:ABC transporter substrate binding protein